MANNNDYWSDYEQGTTSFQEGGLRVWDEAAVIQDVETD